MAFMRYMDLGTDFSEFLPSAFLEAAMKESLDAPQPAMADEVMIA
jgi:hypothetical protein